MTATYEIIVMLFILAGTFLVLASAFGVLRLPDVYTRNHAASKSTTLGVMLILLGTLLYFVFFEDHLNSASSGHTIHFPDSASQRTFDWPSLLQFRS